MGVLLLESLCKNTDAHPKLYVLRIVILASVENQKFKQPPLPMLLRTARAFSSWLSTIKFAVFSAFGHGLINFHQLGGI